MFIFTRHTNTNTPRCLFAEINIFMHTSGSHVRWTGESLCFLRKIFCFWENELSSPWIIPLLWFVFHVQSPCPTYCKLCIPPISLVEWTIPYTPFIHRLHSLTHIVFVFQEIATWTVERTCLLGQCILMSLCQGLASFRTNLLTAT